jgi:hypothetical protein
MLESKFQSELIKEIKDKFKDSIVLKNQPNYIQGFPDLLILYKNKWAVLECKKKNNSKKQPNQDYYITMLGAMSYANFISPENKEEVLNELQQSLKPSRIPRVPRSK